MIRTALLLCAGLLAAVCFACALPQAPPPPPGPRTLTAATCPDKSSFLSHVQYLASAYDPSGNDSSGKPKYVKPPPPGSTIDSNSSYADALQNAFQLAPPQVQTQLCNLGGTDNSGNYTAGIYINGAACSDFNNCFANSWGYRAKQNKLSYIAIAGGLWGRGGTSYVYHLYETDLLNTLLSYPSVSASYQPQYTSANASADNFDMTILAALAHELGHVRWYAVLGSATPGNHYDPNLFCPDATGNGTFFVNSWVTPITKPPKWRHFGEIYGTHLATPQISTINGYITSNNINYAAYLIDQLYNSSAPWASYFAALSPDEDFVETYKLYVLMNTQTVGTAGKLTSLPIQVYNGLGQYYAEDVPNQLLQAGGGKAALAAKLQCIAKYAMN